MDINEKEERERGWEGSGERYGTGDSGELHRLIYNLANTQRLAKPGVPTLTRCHFNSRYRLCRNTDKKTKQLLVQGSEKALYCMWGNQCDQGAALQPHLHNMEPKLGQLEVYEITDFQIRDHSVMKLMFSENLYITNVHYSTKPYCSSGRNGPRYRY